MTQDKLKSDMISLWERTFHDSPDYVGMVFDAYFNPDLCAWRYENEHLAAALLGVPYTFGSANGSLHGLYLCGLATEEAFRGRGLMSGLIEEINRKAADTGFSFTFLIPADSGLRKFYQDRGYSAAMRNVVERYTAGHSFFRDYENWVNRNEPRLKNLRIINYEKLNVWNVSPSSEMKIDESSFNDSLLLKNDDINEVENNILTNSEFTIPNTTKFNDLQCDKFNILKYENLNISESENIIKVSLPFNKIFNFLNRVELSGTDLNLIHSPLDLYLVIKDCKSSGDEVLIVSDDDESLLAMAFVTPGGSEVKVKRLYSIDPGARLKLLQSIADHWPDTPIEIINFPTEISDKVITDIFYGSNLPEVKSVPAVGFAERAVSRSSNAEIYGMARILHFSDFLKFLANDRRDAKFSIFIKDPNSDEVMALEANRGDFSERVFTKTQFQYEFQKSNSATPVVLTPQQVQALLFRKSENEDAVTLAFGLPALPMNMAMLLD